MDDNKLIEELARTIEHGLAHDVERDVYAGETCIEERRCVAARLLPIIRRREIEAGEKVRDAAHYAVIYSPKSRGQSHEAGILDADDTIRALDIPAILKGESHE